MSDNGKFLVSRVKEIYSCFLQKKDFFHYCVPDPVFRWGVGEGKDKIDLAWGGTHRGKEEITERFLKVVGGLWDISGMEIIHAGIDVDNPRLVMIVVKITGKGVQTGKTLVSYSYHQWEFNKDNLAKDFLEIADTNHVNQGIRP